MRVFFGTDMARLLMELQGRERRADGGFEEVERVADERGEDEDEDGEGAVGGGAEVDGHLEGLGDGRELFGLEGRVGGCCGSLGREDGAGVGRSGIHWCCRSRESSGGWWECGGGGGWRAGVKRGTWEFGSDHYGGGRLHVVGSCHGVLVF